MTEWRLYDPDDRPDFFTSEWHDGREHAPHLEQPVHQPRMALAGQLVSAAVDAGAKTIVDLGCGDGGMLQLLTPLGSVAWGYDLMPANVDHGQDARGMDVRYADFVHDAITWADIAVCTECLEHLEDPHAMVRRIALNSRFLVASSPADEDGTQHDGVHAWAWDMDGYRALLEQAGIKVLRHELAGGGRTFQVILGECP